jgi:hypothetical protein
MRPRTKTQLEIMRRVCFAENRIRKKYLKKWVVFQYKKRSKLKRPWDCGGSICVTNGAGSECRNVVRSSSLVKILERKVDCVWRGVHLRTRKF